MSEEYRHKDHNLFSTTKTWSLLLISFTGVAETGGQSSPSPSTKPDLVVLVLSRIKEGKRTKSWRWGKWKLKHPVWW